MMRYNGFGVGHVDSAVRANTDWLVFDQSISEISQDNHVDDNELAEDLETAGDDDLNPENNSASDSEPSDDDIQDDPEEVDEDPYADL